ncbi:sodium- and chloride-dependent GABA transporter ine-like [Haemaphysalis longicornis]
MAPFLYVMVFLHVTTGVVLLARALTLTGAFGGLRSVFYADWSALANIEMWSDALYVSLESVGVTGTMYLGIARFNDFQNIYQEDVAFVLVADTASKGLRTVIAFMFLGHLSSTVDIDITTLVTDSESHFVAGTMEQAMSAVPYQEFWSHVHSLWLISTMLPKFLIVPEIILEVLAASHPLVLTNRSVVHFFVCSFMVVVSILVCNPLEVI